MSTSSFAPQRRHRPRGAAAVLAVETRTAVAVALAGLLTAGCSFTIGTDGGNPGSGAEGANSGGGTAVTTPGAHVRVVRLLDAELLVGEWTCHERAVQDAVTSQTPAQADAAKLGVLLRAHWQVEGPHWVRDVTFGEDASRIRTASGRGHLVLRCSSGVLVGAGYDAASRGATRRQVAALDEHDA